MEEISEYSYPERNQRSQQWQYPSSISNYSTSESDWYRYFALTQDPAYSAWMEHPAYLGWLSAWMKQPAYSPQIRYPVSPRMQHPTSHRHSSPNTTSRQCTGVTLKGERCLNPGSVSSSTPNVVFCHHHVNQIPRHAAGHSRNEGPSVNFKGSRCV